MKRFLFLLVASLLFNGSFIYADGFDLGSGGMIVFEVDAGEVIQLAAAELAQKLSATTDSVFLTGNYQVSPAIFLIRNRKPVGALERDGYEISTSSKTGISITGNSELAIQHGVWDLLHRIGYRQYFPGDAWEIIPDADELKVDINVKESPAYASRRIWYGYGLWEHNKEAYQDWVKKNRMEGSFSLNTGHAYHRLISSQRAEFDAHPEYYALVNGERKKSDHSKLCISNSGLIDAAKSYGVGFFEKNPEADSVSVDPSDGGNWCECQECVSLGPPNDRAVILANAVAEAVEEKYGPGKFVGMYAYNYHSQPPSIRVHRNVIISAATAFIKEGMKIDEIVSGWADKGATIGIREYYSVNTWDRDLPGAARGGNLEYLTETIPKFHKMGARYLSAESSDNWGPNGFGYYFASRMMWNLDDVEKREDIQEEFLKNCFGPAELPMAAFYRLLDGSNKRARLVYDDLLARMFDALNQSRELAKGDKRIIRRIDDLILYARHAELYDEYRRAAGPERQKAYEAMIRHAYRMRDTFMVHSYALYRDVHNRDKQIELPEDAFWKVPEEKNPWKNSERYPEDEIVAFLREGLANHEMVELDFAAREYQEKNLVAASSILKLPEVAAGVCEVGRGKRSWFTLVDKVPTTLELNITGGLIEHYRDRGNVKVRLSKIGGASETGEEMTLIAEDDSVPPDGKERTVKLKLEEPGIYRIDLEDGSDMTKVTWPAGQRMSWKMSLEDFPAKITGRWTLYFYVPKGTKMIGLYSAAGAGQLLDPDGNVASELKYGGGGFLSIPVPEEVSGRIWKISSASGSVRLLNVPPFLARSPEELVLPVDAASF